MYDDKLISRQLIMKINFVENERLDYLTNNVYNAVIKELAEANFDTFNNEKLNKKIRQSSDEFVKKLYTLIVEEVNNK